jgi:hypothetical protein
MFLNAIGVILFGVFPASSLGGCLFKTESLTILRQYNHVAAHFCMKRKFVFDRRKIFLKQLGIDTDSILRILWKKSFREHSSSS